MNSANLVTLDTDQLKAYLREHLERDFMLIDVRQPDEYSRLHIPGAQLVPFPLLEEEIPNLPKDKTLIFTCRSGIRSRAAATLVWEALGKSVSILNHSGGILSWDGKTLSNRPKVRAFGDLNDFTMVLTSGIDMEKGAWIFYHHVLECFPQASFREAFVSLAQAEENHALALYNLLRKRDQNLPDFTTMFATAKGQVLEGGAILQEEIDKLSRPESDDPITILEMALDIEYTAYELYRHGAEMTSDPEVKRILYGIADAEKTHMRSLSTAFHDLNQ